jgi:hypothetical protein
MISGRSGVMPYPLHVQLIAFVVALVAMAILLTLLPAFLAADWVRARGCAKVEDDH